MAAGPRATHISVALAVAWHPPKGKVEASYCLSSLASTRPPPTLMVSGPQIEPEISIRCTLCDTAFTRMSSYNTHCTRQVHRRKEEQWQMYERTCQQLTALRTAIPLERNFEVDHREEQSPAHVNHPETSTVSSESPCVQPLAPNPLLYQNFSEPPSMGVDVSTSATHLTSFYPFPSKTFFLLYLMVRNPKYKMSVEHLKFVWSILGLLGVDMPPLGHILDFHKTLPLPYVSNVDSPFGPFSVISIKDSLRMEVSKPHVMNHLILYPDDTKDFIEGAWTGTKWKQDPALQTPMIRVNSKDFWVHDFAIVDASSAIRISFFYIEGERIKAYGNHALLDTNMRLHVSDLAVVVDTHLLM